MQSLRRIPSSGTPPAATAAKAVDHAADDLGGLTLYRQPGIHVTPEWFVVAGRRFPVRELSNLRTTRGAPDRFTVRAVTATALVLVAVGAALGYRGLDRLNATTCLALLGAVFVPALLAWVGHRRRPRPYELWGTYRGMDTLLFRSDEERQFGQVTRALVRAREISQLGGLAEPIADGIIWIPQPVNRPAPGRSSTRSAS
ncbi:MAG TPA: DUF6232 family protein [Micromonospora sp.]|jgi:hypothetical protein